MYHTVVSCTSFVLLLILLILWLARILTTLQFLLLCQMLPVPCVGCKHVLFRRAAKLMVEQADRGVKCIRKSYKLHLVHSSNRFIVHSFGNVNVEATVFAKQHFSLASHNPRVFCILMNVFCFFTWAASACINLQSLQRKMSVWRWCGLTCTSTL